MPQDLQKEEPELPELASKPKLQTDEPGGGGIKDNHRKPIDLDGFPEDCGGYGIDDKPRGRYIYAPR